VLGSALITIPVARVMARSGRRPGLLLGYALAGLGCLLIIVSAQVGSFPLMLLGSLLFGASTTANNQARYAGADLARPERRGRDLSLVVWATTLGSVVGPNLVGPAEPVAAALGLPRLTGSFVFALIGFALAAAVIAWRLRPDPLLVARAAAEDQGAAAPSRGLREGLRAVRRHPRAVLGLLTMACGHAVMVSVMVMTPLHMDHGGASLRLIGFVISVHILGMFAFSPVVGWLVDRFGGPVVALGGSVVLVLACLLAARTHEGMSTGLTVALFTLGLGWSATLVSGSTMLTGALEVRERAAGQGVSDLLMGLAGAGCGAVAGVVLDQFSYAVLAYGGVVIATFVTVGVLALGRR
jgi:MFS family permease